jgi:dihydrofolate reductase
MRKIVSGLFMSLDGVVESPQQWQFPYVSEEVGATIGAQLAGADTLLLGRRTYQEFAGYWSGRAGSDDPMADLMNTVPKLVVSTTLDRTDWQGAALVKGDLADELRRLKRELGKNLRVTGSLTLVRWLLGHELLDELALLVCPVLVGHGGQLFDGAEPKGLELVDSATFRTGVLSLTYRSAASAATGADR